jgi:hypothetical protein
MRSKTFVSTMKIQIREHFVQKRDPRSAAHI